MRAGSVGTQVSLGSLAPVSLRALKALENRGEGLRRTGIASCSPSTQTMNRLLLVDDEVCMLRTLTRLFSPYFDVTAVSSADDALRLVAGGLRFDAAVLDYDLGGPMCGLELLELLRARLPALAEHAIVLSGGPPRTKHDMLAEALGSRWILKPFSNEHVRTVLSATFTKRASSRPLQSAPAPR